jgi:HD-GYP domain-containing protein (c-di-GMP phosphodiesterase class II)
MTTTSVSDASALLSEGLPQEHRPKRRRALIWMVLAMVVVMGTIAFGAMTVLDRRRAEVTADLETRLTLLSAGAVEVIETWLYGLAGLPAHLVNGDQFRLFATELDLAASEPDLSGQLAAQTPYMAEALTEFVRQSPATAAYLLDTGGRVTLGSARAPEPTAAQERQARAAFTAGAPVFAPLRFDGDRNRPVLDIHLPVRALQSHDPTAEPEPVAVFLMTVPVGERLAALLAPDPFAQPGERRLILQHDGNTWTWLAAGDEGLTAMPAGAAPLPEDAPALPFAARPAVAGDRAAFSVGLPVPSLPWLVVQEADRAAALAPVAATRDAVILFGVLATLFVGGLLAAVWFNEQNARNRALATQFQELAGRIDAHRRLLSGVTGSVEEYIGLKRLDGTYGWVNKAFAEALDRPQEMVVGQSDDSLFGHATARRLAALDREALEQGGIAPTEVRVYFGDDLRHLQITKVPLTREDGRVDGVVSVGRDVSELVEQRRQRDAVIRQTIDALVRTVELSDPHLAGHSRLLSGFSGLVARQLGLTEQDVATLELAGNLSQIGKPLVPREILNKPDRLTPEEIVVMQTHIEYAEEILRQVPFDLPVRETVAQMYERLDGSGYPKGLAGDEIALRARILGICDVFCARIRPRSYRSAITPDFALSILADHPQKYDAAAVAALADVVHSIEGEKLLAAAQAA